MTDHTQPNKATRASERDDAQTRPGPDREPTEEEERLAELHKVDAEVAEHAEEMSERGAKQRGEGRIP